MGAEPRDAATVILARPTGDGGYEVLLTKRPETMRFMGGMYVFPGGTLDAEDCSDALAACSVLDREPAADRLGETVADDLALGLYCCGLREVFEEVGVLLAYDRGGGLVDPEVVRDRYAPRQAEVGADAAAFARFLATEGLVLATELLVPHTRLVTPEISPIRFDARFFVAPFPAGQTLVLDPKEVPEARWMRPSEAIRASGEGRIGIGIPTMAVLQGLAEVPGYDQLLRGERSGREIVRSPMSPNVTCILAPNPSIMTGPGTNSYVVGHGAVAIIDPAVPDPRYIEALTREAGDRGIPSIVLLTHLHPDHIGGAAVLRAEIGCEVGAWAGAAAEAPFVTRPIADGEELRLGELTIRAHHTPGHASHHLCYELLEERALFAGDVVAGLGTVVVAPPDGDMTAYLETLERLRRLPIERIYPGHGPHVEDGPGKLAEYIAHRRDRERQVMEALEAGLTEIPAMVERIYVDVPTELHATAELSVLAHLEMLEAGGRVRREDDRWTLVGPDQRA